MISPRRLDRATARPAPFRRVFSEFVKLAAGAFLAVGGWRMQGDWPGHEKCVLLAAPHTSNWDALNMLAAAAYYRVKLRWMGKKSLTTGPFGFLMKWVGCVPVDRASSNDLVSQMRSAFQGEERLVLAVAPEGTRTLNPNWKSGYYHIAIGAGVPIVLSVLDYGARTITLSGVIHPSGDYDADSKWIKAHYADAVARFPDKFTTGPQ